MLRSWLSQRRLKPPNPPLSHKSIFLGSFMQLLIPILVILFVVGCNTTADTFIPKKFNESEFTGLVSLGLAYADIKLDYELEDLNGKPIKFTTCQQVDGYNREKIQASQYRLITLLQVNCAAAKYFFSGKPAANTQFSQKLSLDLVKSFPAAVAPFTSREDMAKRQNKQLNEYEKKLVLKSSENGALTVIATDGEEITYTVMSKADMDNDSNEDIVVRLDWNIPNSFGQGFDLVLLSKTSAVAPIKLLWRYTK